MKKMKIIMTLLILFAVIMSCAVEGLDDDEKESGTSESVIVLPAGLTLKGVSGDNTGLTDITLLGRGFALLECDFGNDTTDDIIYEIPAGLVFVSDNSGTQNMVVLQKITVIIMPGGKKEYIPTFCLDEEKTAPGNSDTFQLKAKICSQPLEKVINLCSNKDINATNMAQVQMIVYDCIRNNELSAANENTLKALPNK